MLTVRIYPDLGAIRNTDDEDLDAPEVEGGVEFTEVDYVSLVSDETYGPPALIAPARGKEEARAVIGERVLYINTAMVPLWEIERTSE